MLPEKKTGWASIDSLCQADLNPLQNLRRYKLNEQQINAAHIRKTVYKLADWLGKTWRLSSTNFFGKLKSQWHHPTSKMRGKNYKHDSRNHDLAVTSPWPRHFFCPSFCLECATGNARKRPKSSTPESLAHDPGIPPGVAFTQMFRIAEGKKKTRIVRESPRHSFYICNLQKIHPKIHLKKHIPRKIRKKLPRRNQPPTDVSIFALVILFSSLALCFVNNCSFRFIVLLFRRTNFHINRLMIANISAVAMRNATSQGSGSLDHWQMRQAKSISRHKMQ